MSKRTCDMTGCDKPHRARGLCVTHWNQKYGKRKTVEVECPTCGTVTTKQDNGNSTRRFCSFTCRELWRLEQPDTHVIQPRVCRLPDDHPAMWFGTTCRLDQSECQVCGSLFMHRPRRRTLCSPACAERAHAMRKRGREQVRRTAIFERDGYACWICDLPTSLRYSPNDLLSPTIDHLVPVAFGGGDEADNLATAHMICNSRRGACWDISPAA